MGGPQGQQPPDHFLASLARCRADESCSTREGSAESEGCPTESQGTASRQESEQTAPRAPGPTWAQRAPLHENFDQRKVGRWAPGRFEEVGKLQDASRNRGEVLLMRDTADGKMVAVKRMPNQWIGLSALDFKWQHPRETELPWQDIGCTAALNANKYAYACQLFGVYRDRGSTYVVMELASEGDLITWCSAPASVRPGPVREVVLRPLARQMFKAVQQLHDMSIVHCDLSLENVLLTRAEKGGPLCIRIIDFGMASTARFLSGRSRGKPSYQAPELHEAGEYDGFLADTFALGVTLYAMLVQDLPWQSTRPGRCPCFEFVRRHGLPAFVKKRRARGREGTVADMLSTAALRLLEGLLALEPERRLTLSESVFDGERRHRGAVWQEPWLA